MTPELILRAVCVVLGVVAVLGGVHSGRARTYNVRGELGARGVLVIGLGFALIVAGWTGWGMGALA